jgi:hypothetical protein
MFTKKFVADRLKMCSSDELITIINVFNEEYEKPVLHDIEDLDKEFNLNRHYGEGFDSEKGFFIVDGNTLITMTEEEFINQYYNADEVAEWITDLDEIGELRTNILYSDILLLIDIEQDEFCH